MANEAFPLDVIQEEEPEEDLEEWQRTNDPAQLKQHRTQAKRIHTMALNQALLAVRMQEDVGTIEIERTSLVRAYDIVERIHRRYVEVCKFDGEDLDRETSWGIDISIKHSRALTDMANYIDSLQARARSVAGSSRSSVSNRSSTSSTRRKLQEAERLEKETQLRIQQEKAEALQQAEEEERRMQLEIARKAEEKRVEASRKERQLKMELERQRYTSSLLRKQLADELAETEETDEIETSGFDKTDVWKTSNVPFHAPATPVPEFCMPYRPATTTQPCSQHGPAASQQPFTFDQPSSSFPNLNVNASSYAPTNIFDRVAQQINSSARPPSHPTIAMSAPPVHNRFTQQTFPSQRPVPDSQPTVYSPDAWIFTVNRHDAPPTFRSSSRPPKAEPPKFDGNPINWPMFIQSFKVQIHDTCFSDAERQHHLRACLTTEIQKNLGEVLLNPGLYSFALKELHRKFGNPRIVSTACSSLLLKLSSFKDSDYESLKQFSSTLRSVVATLQLGGYGLELHSSTTLAQLVGKLPPNLRSKWAEVSYRIQDRLPTILDLDTWLDDVTMAEYFVRVGVDPTFQQGSHPKTRENVHKSSNEKPKKSTTPPMVFSTTVNIASCPYCDGAHRLYLCEKFKALNPTERSEVVKEKRCCYRCLDYRHLSSECKREKECGTEDCKRLHHPLLHGAPRMYPKTPQSSPTSHSSRKGPFNGAVSYGYANETTLLPIVPMVIEANGRTWTGYGLLDPGSQISMITNALANELGLQGEKGISIIGTYHGRDPTAHTTKVSFRISSLDKSSSFEIPNCYSVPVLKIKNENVDLKKLVKDWPHLAGLKVPAQNSVDVNVLIGSCDMAPQEVLEIKRDPLNERAPRGLRTAFGWCIAGPISPAAVAQLQCNSLSLAPPPDQDLVNAIDRFLLTETYEARAGVKVPVSDDELRANKILNETTRFVGDRYESGFLWKNEEPNLPDNSQSTLARFLKLERRLIADENLGRRYSAAINEYISLGHARKLSAEEVDYRPAGRTWFLPHHPVINPKKPDKCRPVFDASAYYKGMSLNFALLKGPDLLTNLIGVLLRFRQHPMALSADIVKMFHQVRVRPQDGPALRFFYRDPGIQEPPSVYQMNVQPFGAVCSPTICAHVLRQAAEDGGIDAADASKQVIDHFYVDNWLTSFPTAEEAIQQAKRVTNVLRRGGFELAQWGSSCPKVLLSLPGNPVSSIDLALHGMPIERTLGLSLDYGSDSFVVSASIKLDGETKREILRETSSVYDPFGFLSPVLLQAKLILQAVCRKSVGWDDQLDQTTIDEWQNWAISLSKLNPLSVPRCFYPELPKARGVGLHLFADASESAFGAIAYFRFDIPDGVKVSFVMAKARVAPIKYVSIPRLELCAALLAARLASVIKSELRLKIDQTTFWSDSTTVLRWINSPHYRFHIYVGNRIGEVLELSESSQWRYVPTAQNPADDVSRGVTSSEFSIEHRFFTGPSFLYQSPQNWPAFPDVKQGTNEVEDPEVRCTRWVGVILHVNDSIDQLTTYTSRYPFLVGVVGYVKRFISNARKEKTHREFGKLSETEVKNAEAELFRRAQMSAFPEDYSNLKEGKQLDPGSSLITLTPFIDHQRVLRVGGRIENAPAPPEARHPIILPADEKITKLLIYSLHLEFAHSTTERTFHELRKVYWVQRGRKTVRRIISKCFKCKQHYAKALCPMMAALPGYRLKPFYPAFTHTGVDFFGPYNVKIFRRKVKRWACLFTCMSSRAVHLEMAYSLDTSSFINCISRFEDRRTTPQHYHSDNGTNFVGAVREFSECLRRMEQLAIRDGRKRRTVTWSFNPPAAPHFGGTWERLVQSSKRALRFVLNEQTLTDDTLVTTLIQVEKLLNGRPLTYVSVNPADPEPITPNHLLLGHENPYVPFDMFDENDMTTKRQYRIAQYLTDCFWRRWMREYLPSLTERRKWLYGQKNLNVGDIVIVIEPDTPRGEWPIARVVKVFSGPDGVVRSAIVHLRSATKTSELHRPAVKLCLLESWDTDGASAYERRAGYVPNPTAPNS
ncbi:uncharacterized protein LOC130693104 [Daphnia carinata]|uniref:uncharacterized protein LOC130693104 n=1 Tax=Daphnia carinata TaxID=120202 RepID=UPI00257F2D3E|nr:uncharacterized protein LOC130693104 [Daphnia carinata]